MSKIESTQITTEDLERFLRALELNPTVNFPYLADTLGMSWQGLRHHLYTNKTFQGKVEVLLERMSYQVQDNYFKAAMGHADSVKLPPINAIKYVIEMLRNGSFFGRTEEESASADDDKPMTQEEEEALKKRLGL